MVNQQPSIHRVVTFYSYKGGVGRSMALANIAVLLANWGYKTLVIDWDLEAPGLENFYQTCINSNEVKQNKGLIDLLSLKAESENITVEDISWSEYMIPVPLTNSRAELHLLTAGKRDEHYVQKIKAFDYNNFYSEKGGGDFIESLREKWLDEYNFILIDSRTGLTDSSGVCSIHMPDMLVLLFTPNEQSFNGIKNVAQRAIEGQKQIIYDRYKLRTLPLPSRIENQETVLLDEWMNKIYTESDAMLDWLPKGGQELKHLLITPAELLGQIKIPYKTYYAYGERLAVTERGTTDYLDIGYAYETIAAIIANDLQDVDMLKNARDNYLNKAKGEVYADTTDFMRQIDLERKEKERAISEVTEEKDKEVDALKRKVKKGHMASVIRSFSFIALSFVLVGLIYFRVPPFDFLKKNDEMSDSLKMKKQYVDFLSLYTTNDTNQLDPSFNINMLQLYYKLQQPYRDSAIEIKSTIEKVIAYKYYDLLQDYYTALNESGFKASAFFADSVLEFGSLTNVTPSVIQQKIDSIKAEDKINNVISDTASNDYYSDSTGFYIAYVEKGNYLLDTKAKYISLENKAVVCFSFNGRIKSYKYVIVKGKPAVVEPPTLKPDKPNAIIVKTPVDLFICSSTDAKSISVISSLVKGLNNTGDYNIHVRNNYKPPADTLSPFYSKKNEVRYSGKLDFLIAIELQSEFRKAGFEMDVTPVRINTKNPVMVFLCYDRPGNIKYRPLRTKNTN
jgi:MinD-like ATPase involved in chromosome partitioning or flagellar assembly